MTDPRDPIERWLSTDVELLTPPPGAYERVHRRARRRRSMRALGAASGVAVVIAAAVVLPQVAGNLLPNGGGPASVSGTKSTSATPSTRPSASRGTHHAGGHPAALPKGPALAAGGPTEAPAAGLRPTSVTLVGTEVGAVIGQAPCAEGTCTAAAQTSDYGTVWTRLGAPDAGPANGSSGVSQIRFNVDRTDGWAYGPGLYATHNGGRTWRQLSMPGRVIDLSTVGGMAFAVVGTCTGGGATFAAHCTSFALYRTAIGSNAWSAVPGAAAAGAAVPGGLQLTSQGGYLLAGGRLFSGPVTAGAWHQVRPEAASAPGCLSGAAQPASGPALLAPEGSVLYLACGSGSGLTLYQSADGGGSWQRTGPIAVQGTATSLAAISGGNIVLATTTGIFYSADGTTWHRAALSGTVPPGGFAFVGLTTAQQGVAITSGTGGGRLFVTMNGGRSWRYRPVT